MIAIVAHASREVLEGSGIILQAPRHRAVGLRFIYARNRVSKNESHKACRRDPAEVPRIVQNQPAYHDCRPRRTANRSVTSQEQAVGALEDPGVTDRGIDCRRDEKRCKQQNETPLHVDRHLLLQRAGWDPD